MKTRDWLEGVGAALLLLFSYYVDFFHPRNHDIYHHGLPVTHLIGGVLIDLIAVAILITLLLAFIRQLPPVAQRVVEVMLVGLIAWNIVNFVFQILFRLLYPVSDWENRWYQCAIAVPLLAGVLACIVPRFTAPAVRAIRFFLVTLSFSALWIVPQLVRVAFARPSSEPVTFHPQAYPMSASPRRRIIWILFDELSYQQAFDHPAPGIVLPNFNSLRSTAVSFSRLTPAGFRTEKIIPSLFIDRSFEEYRSTLTGRLSYKDEASGQWVAYDPNSTLFGLASQQGWNPAVDGWYNPYCQLLAPVLSACFWSPVIEMPMEEYGASEDKSVLSNAAALSNQMAAELADRQTTPEDIHVEGYRNIMAHTQALIGDPRFRFLYIHLPVPHPPGIYDRRRHMLRGNGTYLDNLVLADDTLGILMKQIAASPSAAQTTIIVTSDHSWRIMLYRGSSRWSAEEERASQGKFDDRPVLLVHFPGEESGEEIQAVLPEMLEHDMIAAMLRGRMNNVDELVNWTERLAQATSPQLQAHAPAH